MTRAFLQIQNKTTRPVNTSFTLFNAQRTVQCDIVFEMAAMPFPCMAIRVLFLVLPIVLLMFFKNWFRCLVPTFNSLLPFYCLQPSFGFKQSISLSLHDPKPMWIFRPAFGVSSTQTLVEIYNRLCSKPIHYINTIYTTPVFVSDVE